MRDWTGLVIEVPRVSHTNTSKKKQVMKILLPICFSLVVAIAAAWFNEPQICWAWVLCLAMIPGDCPQQNFDDDGEL